MAAFFSDAAAAVLARLSGHTAAGALGYDRAFFPTAAFRQPESGLQKAFMNDFSVFDTVCERLLYAHGLSAENLSASLDLIGAHHVDYADIYCQHTAFESWHLEEGMVKSGSFQIDQGVGVRAVSGEKTAFFCLGAVLDKQSC